MGLDLWHSRIGVSRKKYIFKDLMMTEALDYAKVTKIRLEVKCLTKNLSTQDIYVTVEWLRLHA